jgi:hypothetical protein
MESGQRKILVYSPRTLWLALGMLVLLALLGATVAFNFGKQFAGDELVRLKLQRDQLEAQIENLEQHNGELREREAVLGRSSEIDRLASLEVRNSYAALQGELLELRKELEFYRGIVSPGTTASGLHIQRFELVPGSEANHFDYSLTLTQVKRNDRYARGAIKIEVNGVQDGKRVKLPMSALAAKGAASLNYKFRYFQHFSGELVVPEDFDTLDWPA